MKRKSKIKTILFDVGGVLVLGKNSTWKHGKLLPSGIHLDVADKLKIPLDQYLEVIETIFAKSIEGEISEKETVHTIARKLKITESKLRKLYIWAYKRHLKVNKELHKKAAELKKLGYNVGILSDQWYLSEKALMPKKLYKKFNPIIVSCDVGVRKPNPKIYKIAIKRSKVKSEEILFIDNQEWNIPEAKKQGMKVIQFKGNKELFEEKLWKQLF
jgi:putative hydrolase of the HAD superfamily